MHLLSYNELWRDFFLTILLIMKELCGRIFSTVRGHSFISNSCLVTGELFTNTAWTLKQVHSWQNFEGQQVFNDPFSNPYRVS